MILELKTGRKRNKGLKRIEHTRNSTVIRSPQKKRTSHERFVNTSGVRSENQGYPIWRNDFGDKNGAQAKQRVEAYWHTRNSTVIRYPTKNEPPMRGSLTLPEFVPKTKGSRFGAMILELKTGRKRNKGSMRIEHTRESLLSRSNSFLAQKHSPNQKPWAIMAAATFLKPAILAPFI